MHWVICSALPLKVTARSVEFGNISLATCMEQPVVWRISLIFEPLLPVNKYKITTLNFIHQVYIWLTFSLHCATYQLTIHIDWRAQSIEWVFEFYQLCQHHWTASTTETGFKLVMWSGESCTATNRDKTLEQYTHSGTKNFLCTVHDIHSTVQYSRVYVFPWLCKLLFWWIDSIWFGFWIRFNLAHTYLFEFLCN